MKISVFSVGKKPRGAEQELMEDYLKRIQKPWEISWHFINHETGDPESAKRAESSALLDLIPTRDFIILLDERGKLLDNQVFARLLDPVHVTQDVTIIVGGAYGVDERIRERANTIVALSKLVFPHKLVRVLLAEQLYRTQSILQGHPYHHG